MKFRVKPKPQGLHHAPPAPHQHTDGHWYEAGEILESPHDLREMFPEKFDRVRDIAKVTAKNDVPPPPPDAPDEDEDDDLMVVDEQPTEPAKIPKADQPLAKTKIPAPGAEEKPAKKEPAKARAKAPASEASEAGSGDIEDVTDKFPRASQSDLTVHHSKEEGFVVKDKDKVVSQERMTTKAKVNKFLRDHAGTDDEEEDDDEEA